MIKIYNTNIQTNITQEQKIIEKGCWINMVSPSENDIQMVCNSTGISDDFIRYALDYEEKARIDIEDDDIDRIRATILCEHKSQNVEIQHILL